MLIDEDEEIVHLNIKTALNAGKKIAMSLNEKTRYIVIPGSLVTKTILDMIETSIHYKHVSIIIKDATRIFIEYRDWMYFKKINIDIQVIDEIKLIAVTINPSSPDGYFFDSTIYKEKLQSYLKSIPVIDVMK